MTGQRISEQAAYIKQPDIREGTAPGLLPDKIKGEEAGVCFVQDVEIK